jgi:ariadne-1
MLRKYRWTKQRLFDDWCKDHAKVLHECGLKKRVKAPMLVGEFECILCSSTVPMAETFALGCGHRFCLDCWRSWASAEMDKGPQAIYTTCPNHPKCQEIIPDNKFLELLDEPKKKTLQMWLIRNFIEGHTSLKWCPNPKCNHAVYFEAGGQIDIECVCGHRFCFSCLEEAHSPCPCHLVGKWLEKNRSDKENTEWIMANTKACPKCKVHIEKNQGCNHMTCRNCRHEFCWLCKGDWTKHGSTTGGFYQCNVYNTKKDSATQKEEAVIQEAKDNLNRYIFYFSRYENHDRAVKFALTTLVKAEITDMPRLQEIMCGSIKSVDFVSQAIKTVIQCRRALKWSYVLGYYLKDGTRLKDTFVLDQGNLESFADKLHGMVEQPVDKLAEEGQREKIISLTNTTAKYQKNLAENIQAGRYDDM